MKLGSYKEGKFMVTYYGNGTICTTIPHPRDFGDDNSEWDNLPDGKLPEPEYKDLHQNARLEFIDFGATPPEVISVEEANRRMNLLR